MTDRVASGKGEAYAEGMEICSRGHCANARANVVGHRCAGSRWRAVPAGDRFGRREAPLWSGTRASTWSHWKMSAIRSVRGILDEHGAVVGFWIESQLCDALVGDLLSDQATPMSCSSWRGFRAISRAYFKRNGLVSVSRIPGIWAKWRVLVVATSNPKCRAVVAMMRSCASGLLPAASIAAQMAA